MKTDGERGGPTQLRLVRGDITRQEVDAVVNAANSGLLGGGGVDGAIHRAGGPEILRECRALRAGDLRDGLRTGEAVATTAGRLSTKRVIHTVGPVWHGGGRGEPERLAAAYRSSLEVARAEGLRSVAFPAISTGVYGYPVEAAARVAVSAVRAYLAAYPEAFREVRFVVFSEGDQKIYRTVLEEG